MNISPEFISAMGVCDEAKAQYIMVFGEEPQRYWEVYDAVKSWRDAGIGIDGWLKWSNSLRDNPDAIRWWDRYTELDEWRVSVPDADPLYFTNLDDATAKQRELLRAVFDEAITVSSYDDATGDVSDYSEDACCYMVYNPVGGTNTITPSEKLEETKESAFAQFVAANSIAYGLTRKVLEHDDDMFVWEAVA